MKSLTTYLYVTFMGMFWIFRIIVAFCYNLGIDFVTAPIDLNFEIVLLFLTFVAMILVVKRNIFGAIIYLIRKWFIFWNEYILRSFRSKNKLYRYIFCFYRNSTTNTYII